MSDALCFSEIIVLSSDGRFPTIRQQTIARIGLLSVAIVKHNQTSMNIISELKGCMLLFYLLNVNQVSFSTLMSYRLSVIFCSVCCLLVLLFVIKL